MDKKLNSALKTISYWRLAQILFLIVGLVIIHCLIYSPNLGITLLWNVLVPVAPVLLVVFAGVWRNVCPLATATLIPNHVGLTFRKKLSHNQVGLFNLIGVISLFIIVPLRHAIFDMNGLASALLLIGLALIGITLNVFYNWKSAWCSGVCPVHSVEKLYSSRVLISPPNVQCKSCHNCIAPCPDSTPNFHPLISVKTVYHKISGHLIVGGLPGFIWGWFQVADRDVIPDFIGLLKDYTLPVIGLMVTLALFMTLQKVVDKKHHNLMIRLFAVASVSCYYWYRIPALIGFGIYPKDGLLLDIHQSIPYWSVRLITILTSIFFMYWMVGREHQKKSWTIRPNAIRVNQHYSSEK